MIDNPENKNQNHVSPFQEEVVLQNYFAGASRADLLARLQEGIDKEVPLLVLTGEEGSGKTMLCRLLECSESPQRKNVLVSWSVDSFEDILRIIVMELGLDTVIEQDGTNSELVLEQIIEFLRAESLKLLLIFDEAEDIYLATLERIRKMLDRVVEAGISMQVLFSGREIFLENFDQLSICDFQVDDSLLLGLQPLTEAETGDYLRDCERRLGDEEFKDVFTEELVSEIFAMANGNYRMTNILAEESVKSHGDDTSFMVLLENVKDDVQQEVEQRSPIQYSEIIKRGIPYYPWIGGGVCCLLILLLFFGGEDEDTVLQVSQQDQKEQTLIVVEESQGTIVDPGLLEAEKDVVVAPIPDADEDQEIQEVKGRLVEAVDTPSTGAVVVPEVGAEEGSVTTPVTDVAETRESSSAQSIQSIQQNASVAPASETEIDQQSVTQAAKAAEKTAVERAEEIAAGQMKALEEGNAAREVAPEKHKIVIEEGVKLVQLQPRELKRKKPVIHARVVKSPVKKVSGQAKEGKEAAVSVAPVTAAVEQLYRNRVSAGSSWKRKDVKRLYTVQLMVLAAEGAEKNLKEMLAQVNYRQEAGNFYIFNKPTNPESLFVFYGEYPSMEMARLVKDSLPKFLRDHKPYALPVEKAVAKVTP